ncbi:MAG: hypothetical protein Q9214_008013, partial [Letrouitia sp. 1 TL-2023]
MKQEVFKFPSSERSKLLEAAESWRWPYWDWAMKKPVPGQPHKVDYNVPLVILTREVQIRLPTTLGYGNVPNAFYQFTMPKGITMGDPSLEDKDKDPLKDLRIFPVDYNKGYKYPFDVCKATSRHPKSETGVNQDWIMGKQDNEAIVKELRDYRWDPKNNNEDKNGNLTASLRDAFYRLTTIKNFEDFATKRAG